MSVFQKHSKDVEIAALYLFCFTAVVVVPVNIASAVRAVLASGAIGNAFRGIMAEIVSLFYIIVAFSLVLVADRAGGITALVVFAFYHFYKSDSKKRGKQIFLLIASGILLAVISSVVAIVRVSNDGIASALNGRILLNIFEEMGFVL